MDAVAVLVEEHLDFDVARSLQIAFEVNAIVAEGFARLVFASKKVRSNSSGFLTRRIPRPPPPATALSIRGKPISLAAFSPSASERITGVPGSMGSPARSIARRADTLSPMIAIALADGPINVMFISAHISTKLVFSERNP